MKNRLAVIIGILALTLSGSTFTRAQEDGDPSANPQEVPNVQLEEPSGPPSSQPPSSQPYSQPSSSQAEPASSVARISLMHGDVSTQRGDSSDWTAVVLNQPLLTGDKVSTGVNSRTEVQLDSANVLRLGDNTLASIANLTRNEIQIQVSRGLLDYIVFKGAEAEVEIDTANVAVHPLQKDGIYRVEVNAEGETQVIVRKGEAEISTPQGSTRLEQGRMIIVRGTADQAQYKEQEAPAKDSWDSWNIDRDQAIRDADSWSHTNRNYVGSEDLDSNGRWQTVPDYGPVWAPTVAPGWAPYRAGRWVWEPGWGWTWVSYEPWGWAPYHYGRWFVYNNSWVWWPGPVVGYPAYRPIWAPAYVSFFGFGGGVGFGVGFGFGSVGWLPCGPGDRFYPWYGRYGNRFNSVAVVNVTNIHNSFGGYAPLRAAGGFSNLRMAATDQRVRMGVSSVAADRFGTGRGVPGTVSREEFNGGRMMAGNLPVVPSRASLSASNRPAPADTIHRGAQSQRFFSNSRPGAAPQSFERQAARVQQSIQRNSQFRPITADAGRGMTNVPRPGQNSAGEFRGNSLSGSQAARGSSTMESQGWRRFNSNPGQNQAGSQNSNSRYGGGASAGASAGYRSPQAGSSVRSESSVNNEGWRHFTPQSGGAMQDPRGLSRGQDGLRGPQDSPRSYSRPPLEMRQPIVTPRASQVGGPARGGYPGGGGYGGGYGGGGRVQPGGGGGASHGGGGGGSHGGGGGSSGHSGGSGHRR